jgi:NAD(P)-dependent dehydrogenase (short-subunit alcohol dehydrogenase family)
MSEDVRGVAVVTGGGQGLGRAVALALDAAGFDVAVIGRTREKLEDTVSRMSGRGLAVVADHGDPDQVRAAFRQIADSLGGVDVLVNNAAIYGPVRVSEASDEQLSGMMANCLMGPIYCIRESIPLMKARGAGDIVNISSQSVETPQPYMTVYAAAKSGLETLSKGLRFELKGEPIRITTFQVGVIADSEGGEAWAPERREEIHAAINASGVGPLFVFPGSSVESLADSIAHVVMAPRDLCLQYVEARGT